MYVTITSSKGLSSEQAERVHTFLGEFLTRLKRQPDVQEILDGGSPDGRDVTTVIVWETEDDAKRYRRSQLIREPIAGDGTRVGLDARRFAVTQDLR